MKKYFFFLILLNLFFSEANAQNVRITIEVKSANDQFHVVPLKENGVVIFYELSAKSQGARTEKWRFTKYDTTFTEEWNVDYPLLNNLDYTSYYIDKENIYVLFTRSKEFQIVKIEQETGELFITNGRLPKEDVDIKHFKILNDYAFFGGQIAPPDASLFYRSCIGFACFPLLFIPNFIPEKSAYVGNTNLQSKLTKRVDLELKGKSEVVNFKTDTSNALLNSIIKTGRNGHTQILVQELKPNGVKTKKYILNTFTPQYYLLDGKMAINPTGDKIIIGTYAREGSYGAQGLYLTKIVTEKQEFVQYQSFTNFNNFFNYLPEKDKEKLTKKITKVKSKGKDYELSYQMLVHEPIVVDSNNYIVVAEAYYPQYHTEFRTTWYYGRPIETVVEIFDGWRYTHAIIAGLDGKGNLLWDNSITIQDILTFNLTEKVKILYNKDQYIAAYSQRGRIEYKPLSTDTSVSKKVTTMVETDSDYEKVKEQYKSDIEYWYGNYFIAYGAQKVKNLDSDYIRKGNTVIYFNKLEIKY